jgi:hypothetical protein
MKNMAKPQQSKKMAVKTGERSLEKAPVLEEGLNPVIKAKAEVQATYQAQSEAQKDFESAFRELQKLDKEAVKDFEKQYQAYGEAVEKAFKVREKAELEALAAYKSATERAGEGYRETMRQALWECKQTTEQARIVLFGVSGKEEVPAFKHRAIHSSLKVLVNSMKSINSRLARRIVSTRNNLMNLSVVRWKTSG